MCVLVAVASVGASRGGGSTQGLSLDLSQAFPESSDLPALVLPVSFSLVLGFGLPGAAGHCPSVASGSLPSPCPLAALPTWPQAPEWGPVTKC